MSPYRVWGGFKLPRPTNGNTKSGFTLVEVMVSLAAMAIGFVILWGMHFTSLRMQRSDSSRVEALRVAKAVMEAQRNRNVVYPGSNATVSPACASVPVSSCNCDGAAPLTPLPFSQNDVDRLDGGNCSLQFNWPADWQRQVAVTVRWRERTTMTGGGSSANKRSQSLQLKTIYTTH
jgi:prepilin-type N-terminal cleavage/methylation domain-containing protein